MNTANNYADLFYNATEINPDLLEKNVEDYPASSVAQFLLLYHKKKNDDPGFENSLKQIGMYLNNPYWIQYQLLQTTEINDHSAVTGNNNDEPVHFSQKEFTEEPLLIPEVSDVSKTSDKKMSEEISIVDSHEINEKEIESTPEEKNSPSQFIENQQENIESLQTETEIKNETVSKPKAEWEKEIPLISEVPVVTDTPMEKMSEEINMEGNTEESEEVIENLSEEKNSSFISEENMQETKESLQPVAETQNLTVSDTKEQFEESPEDDLKQTLDKQERTQSENEQTSIAQPSSTVIESLQNNIKENEPELVMQENIGSPETNEVAIAFEPLHTVDYFASQGIKISEEALENDQLGKQVKSFTAWLKSMKKLHPGQLPEQNEVIEKIIQSSSEASNNEANILTEAMAEVLVMQDKKEKAVEMYQKLSLLNPSKSAYFAAKIESLKTT